MTIECPKCKYHLDHIVTIEVSPLTHQRWRVERCPHCDYAGWPDTPELERDYIRRNKYEAGPDSSDKRFFGL